MKYPIAQNIELVHSVNDIGIVVDTVIVNDGTQAAALMDRVNRMNNARAARGFYRIRNAEPPAFGLTREEQTS